MTLRHLRILSRKAKVRLIGLLRFVCLQLFSLVDMKLVVSKDRTVRNPVHFSKGLQIVQVRLGGGVLVAVEPSQSIIMANHCEFLTV